MTPKHPFQVGQTYRNRAGAYTVVEIDGAMMTIQFASGVKTQTDIAP